MSDMLNADMFGSSQKNAQSSTEPPVNRYTPREPAQKLTLAALIRARPYQWWFGDWSYHAFIVWQC